VEGLQVILDVIDFITIATLGNAQDFGDLTVNEEQLVLHSSPTRGVFLVELQ
jgi:hypothetical protein